MAYVITSSCIKDELCVDVCPTDCIHPKKDEAEFEAATQLYVDPQGCIDCGACVPVCTSDSIKPVEDLSGEQQEFIATNAAFFTEGDDPLGSPGGAAKVGPQVRDTEYVANYTPTE